MRRCRIAVRISRGLDTQLRHALEVDGVSRRKKSLWVSEAIEAFVALGAKSILERNVLAGECLWTGEEGSVAHGFVLDDELDVAICSLIAQIRCADPYIDCNQSTIIRASILHRMQVSAASK